MAFRSNQQRKAVMAKIHGPGFARKIGNNWYQYVSVRNGSKVNSVYCGKVGPVPLKKAKQAP